MKKGKLLASLFFKIVIIGVCSTFYLVFILQMLNSDKLVRDYMPLFTEFIFSFLALILSMSSVTIFANLNKNVRGSKVKCFLSFFLLPILITCCIAVFLETTDGLKESYEYFLATICPFYLILIREYHKGNF